MTNFTSFLQKINNKNNQIYWTTSSILLIFNFINIILLTILFYIILSDFNNIKIYLFAKDITNNYFTLIIIFIFFIAISYFAYKKPLPAQLPSIIFIVIILVFCFMSFSLMLNTFSWLQNTEEGVYTYKMLKVIKKASFEIKAADYFAKMQAVSDGIINSEYKAYVQAHKFYKEIPSTVITCDLKDIQGLVLKQLNLIKNDYETLLASMAQLNNISENLESSWNYKTYLKIGGGILAVCTAVFIANYVFNLQVHTVIKSTYNALKQSSKIVSELEITLDKLKILTDTCSKLTKRLDLLESDRVTSKTFDVELLKMITELQLKGDKVYWLLDTLYKGILPSVTNTSALNILTRLPKEAQNYLTLPLPY